MLAIHVLLIRFAELCGRHGSDVKREFIEEQETCAGTRSHEKRRKAKSERHKAKASKLLRYGWESKEDSVSVRSKAHDVPSRRISRVEQWSGCTGPRQIQPALR